MRLRSKRKSRRRRESLRSVSPLYCELADGRGWSQAELWAIRLLARLDRARIRVAAGKAWPSTLARRERREAAKREIWASPALIASWRAAGIDVEAAGVRFAVPPPPEGEVGRVEASEGPQNRS